MSGDWPYHLREHRGTLLALSGFVVIGLLLALPREAP